MLAVLFGVVAVFYSIVGFGGGSSYIALLALYGVSYTAIPAIALVCNIVVVSGNCFHYIRAGFLNLKLITPLIIASIPMAYIGGQLQIDKQTFLILLFLTLFLTGIRLLIKHKSYNEDENKYATLPMPLSLVFGGILGLVSGIVGIGGGIFLAPILYYFNAASPKYIATTTSVFILVNSASGLIGQLQKSGISAEIASYWYLPLIVLIGGQIGNIFTIKLIRPSVIALLTALLVLFIAGRLGIMIWL